MKNLLILIIITNVIAAINALNFYQSRSYDFKLNLTALIKVPQNSFVIIGMENGGVTLWDCETSIGQNLFEPAVGQPNVHSLIKLANGNIAASATESQNLKMKVWNFTGIFINSPPIDVPEAVTELSDHLFAFNTNPGWSKLPGWSIIPNYTIIVQNSETLVIRHELFGHTGAIQKLIKLTDGNI